jgi:hypothetical protein
MASVQEAHYARLKVDEACAEAGLPANSPVREILLTEAVVVDGVRGEFWVRAQTRAGDISLKERINELRDDPKTAKHFPGEKPTEVSAKMGIQNLSDRFDGIAKGTIKVVG